MLTQAVQLYVADARLAHSILMLVEVHTFSTRLISGRHVEMMLSCRCGVTALPVTNAAAKVGGSDAVQHNVQKTVMR